MAYSVNPSTGELEYRETAGSIGAITNLDVDAFLAPGTDPVEPDAIGHNITLTGEQVASGTVGANVLRSFSGAPNTVAMQIQQTGESATENTALNGVAHFNSTQFNVSNGFVSLAGGGAGIDEILTDDGSPAIIPNGSGQLQFVGQDEINVTGQGPGNTATFSLSTVPISKGGTGQTTKTDAFDALSPTTTKGDLIVYNGTDNVRLPAGADGLFLTTDSTQAEGIRWTTNAGGDVVGPGSSTDNALARFDGTTGKLIQNSNAILTDAGELSLALPLPVSSGGTGVDTLTGIAVGSGTSDFIGRSLAAGNAVVITNANGVAGDPTIGAINTAKWIVDPTANLGTHQTIAAALTAASSGETIFIRPGTYTENLTLKAGVNLVAFTGDANTPNVTIIGKLTYTSAGTVSISNIRLQTNSDFFLAITGSAASVVNLIHCNLNCTNSTGISYTTSSSSALLTLRNCTGNLGTTGICLYANSSAGQLNAFYCYITNSGGSTTANTQSAGICLIEGLLIHNPLTVSGTGTVTITNTAINTTALNVTSFTYSSSSVQGGANFCRFGSGSASAISISTGCTYTISSCFIVCSNTNAITGAGTIVYSGLTYVGSSLINTTTQTGGTLIGIKSGVAPAAGYLGEQIRASVASGSAVALPTGTVTNVAFISLTAGIWDVSAVGVFKGAVTGSAFGVSISTTSATAGTQGDNYITTPFAPTSIDNSLTVPSYRITLTTTTNIYLVMLGIYTVGSLTGYGRISATRVG